MAKVTIDLRVSVAWWVRWYMAGVYMTALAFQLEPDWQKVERTVMRGIKVKVV